MNYQQPLIDHKLYTTQLNDPIYKDFLLIQLRISAFSISKDLGISTATDSIFF